MRSHIIRFMHFIRVHQAWKRQVQLTLARTELIYRTWFDYKGKHLQREFLPNHVEIARLPNLHSLVHISPTIVLTRDSITSTLDSIRPFIIHWRSEHLVALAKRMMRCLPAGSLPSGSPDVLELAICVFSCSDPHFIHTDLIRGSTRRLPMWFPEVLHHACNDIVLQCLPSPVPETAEYAAQDFVMRSSDATPGFRKCAWYSEHLEHHHDAASIAMHILALCGLKHDRTRATDLDSINPWLSCDICHDTGDETNSMSWRHAVNDTSLYPIHVTLRIFYQIQHTLDKHSIPARLRVMGTPSNTDASVDPVEPEEKASWVCTRCVDKPYDIGLMTIRLVLTHIKIW